MQATSEAVRFVIPFDRLEKARTHKYIRRWKGKHGEWQYEYATPEQEREHKAELAEKARKETRAERAAEVTERYDDQHAAERLAEIGGELYQIQATSQTPRGGYERDDAGLSLMDMKAWENTGFLTGKAQIERRRKILAKYIRQIGDEGERFEEYVKLGLWDTLTRQKEERATGEKGPKNFIEPVRSRWGDIALPISGYLAGDLFEKQKELMREYKEHGLKWNGGDKFWFVPAPKVKTFPFEEMAEKFTAIGIPMEVPELPAAVEGKEHAPSDEPPGVSAMTPDDVLAAIKNNRVYDTALVTVIKEGEYKGKYAFYSTFSKEWNAIFSNTEGPLTGINEYVKELGHARVTSDRHMIDEALEHIRKRMPNHTIVIDPAVELQKQSEIESLSENQKPIPEVQKHLAQGVNLFPFQNEGARFLMERDGKALIGDEMGLGKTMQTLAYGAATGKRMLVVCPKVVRKNWLREGTRFFPEYFKGRELRTTDLVHGQPDLTGDNLVTVNYESLEKFLPAIEAAGFDTIVIDESHRMKEPKAKITKLLKKLAPKMQHRILLSGTAIKNKKVELFEQLELIRPGMFGTRDQLRDAFTGRVFHKLQEVYLARRKLDVLEGLPPKISSIVRAEVENPEDLPPMPREIGEMSAAKQQLALAKVPGTVNFVKEMLESSDSNMLVFTDSKEAAKELKAKLGDVAVLHTGDTPDKAREAAVGHFDPQMRKPGDPVRVFVATTQSAGVGINLQTADKVIFNDLPWTPADLRQAEDRAWRIGTKSNVNVYWQTIDGHEFDELIADTIKRKYEIYKKTLEGKKITAEERAWMDAKITKQSLFDALQGKRAAELETPPPGDGPAPNERKTQAEPMVEPPEARQKTEPVGVGVDSPPLGPKEKLPGEQPAVAPPAKPKPPKMTAREPAAKPAEESTEALAREAHRKAKEAWQRGDREMAELHATTLGGLIGRMRHEEKKDPKALQQLETELRREMVWGGKPAAKPPKMTIQEPVVTEQKPPAADHVDSTTLHPSLREAMGNLHKVEAEGGQARTTAIPRGVADKMELWLRSNVGRTVDGGKVEAVGKNAWRWRGDREEITLRRDPKDPNFAETTYSSKVPEPPPPGKPPESAPAAVPAAEEGPQTAVEPKPQGKAPGKAEAAPDAHVRPPKPAKRRGPQIEQMALFKGERRLVITQDGLGWVLGRVDRLIKAHDIDGALDLIKAAGHKYLRRIPIPGGGRRKWRYVYSEASERAAGGELAVGEKLRLTSEGQIGHYEIEHTFPNGWVTVRHDESGAFMSLHRDQLRDLFKVDHAERINATHDRLRKTVAAARKFGTEAQQKRAQDHLLAFQAAWQIRPEPEQPKAVIREFGPIDRSEMDAKIQELAGHDGPTLEGILADVQGRIDATARSPRGTPTELLRWKAIAQAAMQERKDRQAAATKQELETEKEKPPVVAPGNVAPGDVGEAPPVPGVPAEATKTPPQPPPAKKREPVSGKLEAVGDHIYGSIKDLRREGQITSPEQINGMSYRDAARIVKRDNVVSVPDLNVLRGLGMDPEAAHMALGILASIKLKPDDTDEHRRAYIWDASRVTESLLNCKTLGDVLQVGVEINRLQRNTKGWEPAKGESLIPYDSPGQSRSDAVRAARARAQQLAKENPGERYEVYVADSEGNTVSSYSGRATHLLIARKTLKPFEALGNRFDRMIRRDGKEYREVRKMADAIKYGVQQGHDGWELLKASGKMADREKQAEAEKRRQKKEGKGKYAKGKTLRGWSEALQVQKEAVRVGGTEIPKAADPERTRQAFNLREIDYGTAGYMTQADREYHTHALEGAFHDLADMLQVPPHMVSFKGRLGIGLGARGTGTAGWKKKAARAHYEPGKFALNITKMRGGGTLAHEWAHALDNVIIETSVTRQTGAAGGSFATHIPEHSDLPSDVRKAVGEVLHSMLKAADPEKARAKHKADLGLLEDQLAEKIAVYEAKKKERAAIERKPRDEESRQNQLRWKNEQLDFQKAGLARLEGKKGRDAELERVARNHHIEGLEARIKELSDPSSISTHEERKRANELEGDMLYLGADIDGYYRPIVELMRRQDPESTDYAKDAAALGESYFGMPTEMLARAFHSYVEDKLHAAGRKNTYLADGSRVKYNTQVSLRSETPSAQPFPQGAERERIHQAIEKLLGVMRGGGHLEKSLRSEPNTRFVLRK